MLVQIAIVLLVTAACGTLARRLGQTRVIGEIIGGILLGPSVFGRLAPTLSAYIFDKNSVATFDSLSTIGLVLFLFLVGMDLDCEQLSRKRSAAVLASGMSIFLPFATAAVLAPSLHTRFAPPGTGGLPFLLFLGISMSITAFPVLARILEERGLQESRLGITAILCAAVDDIFAWILLGFSLTLIGKSNGPSSLSLRMIGLGAFLILMWTVARPLGNYFVQRRKIVGPSLEFVSVIVAGMLLSAAATDAIGVHPLFGAFFAGICFPRPPGWQAALRLRLEPLTSVLLLPLFFALTGMRTRLDLLADAGAWFWTAIVLAAAIFGKVGGATLASRWSGETWRESFALGALLNTRGLVELVVLNIAYNAGVFSATLFTMLVVMALVTTMITVPILNVLGIKGEGKVRRDIFNAA